MAARIKIAVKINGNTNTWWVPTGTYASALASDRQFKEDFALPSNIRIIVNGSTADKRLAASDIVEVQTVASSKAAARVKVIVHVNGNRSDFYVPYGTTTSTLQNDRQFKEDFALPSNIRVFVNGSESNVTLSAGDVITVQTVASSKALA
jgi:hypothetical protein